MIDIFINKQVKKIMLVMFGLLVYIESYAQGIGGNNTSPVHSDMPNVVLPSPTVASLMKFEEVPVNNYTGIPDISIPLYNVESLSKDISINLSLNYHPSSIAVNEKAAYSGLGWNLFAGGTIARTVRGLPDEIIKYGGSTKIGRASCRERGSMSMECV